jgi:hypothetical protein
MPARLAARFKSDQILVPQLVDDLPRRDAALPRRTCHECMTAGPGSEIGQRTRKRRPFSRHRRGFRGWVVDRGHDPEDVHRHIDLACDGRYLRRLEPAPVVLTVREDHDCAAAAFTDADALGCLSNRVVQRRGAERDDRRHRIGQAPQAGRERGDLVEPRVKRVNRRFVTHVEPAQKVRRSLARARKMPFHAAADVEQQSDAHTAGVVTEIRDGTRPAAIQNFEVSRREVAHEPSFVIAHDSRNADNIHPRLERGHRLLLGEQFTCQAKTQCYDCRESDPRHAHPLVQMHCHFYKSLIFIHFLEMLLSRQHIRNPKTRKIYTIGIDPRQETRRKSYIRCSL